jgi:hypothetical protein
MINKKIIVKFFVMLIVLLLLPLTGCLEQSEEKSFDELDLSKVQFDKEVILPDWQDEEYHDYQATTEKLKDLNKDYPFLVNVFSIGKSVLDRDIWCIRITNEKNTKQKYSCVIDGCIHGNEWEAGELCLYLADYLLVNFGENKTITEMLNNSEVYIIPLLNPDGRENDERYNENGIDLNRNFDVHFGRWKGKSFRLGKIFGFIKIPMINLPRKGIYTNCGRKAFSEPETAALRDFMKSLESNKLSFYVNCHTAVHAVVSLINIDYKPEFIVSENEKKVLNTALSWIDENTEYDTCYVDNYSFAGAGIAHHWVFKEFRVPSFCFELLSKDYEPGYKGGGPHDNLVHWMKVSLPVLMYFLANIKDLNEWKIPDSNPYLPDGVPPESV